MLVGRSGFAFIISQLAIVASLLFSLHMLAMTSGGNVLSYHIGGWAPPLGIEYRVDTANALILVIISAIGTLVLPYARTSIDLEIEGRHHTLFYACFMLCFTGLMGVTVTGDGFNVFVFLEISSLATYVLVALGARRDQRALSAAYDYLILGTIGATFFVIGLGMLYMATGTLNMAQIAERIADQGSNRTLESGFAFILIGMGLKVAIYPLHRWLPGAYSYAPSAVSVFLAATATKVALYVILRFLFSVFSSTAGYERDSLEFIVLPLGVIAMFVGSAIAIYQVDAKRLLAFSSIAQIGYLLLGMSLISTTGIGATMAHFFNHAITKGALFMAVGAIVYRIGSQKLPNMAGLGRQMPWTSAAIVLGGLSLIGIPGTAGFVSKWMLLQGTLEAGWWPVALLIVASSLLAVIYVWRFIETLYLVAPPEGRSVSEAPAGLLVPTWVLIIATIYFGLDADTTVNLARTAADALLAGGFDGGDVIILGGEGR